MTDPVFTLLRNVQLSNVVGYSCLHCGHEYSSIEDVEERNPVVVGKEPWEFVDKECFSEYLAQLKAKAEKWNSLKPETRTILEIATKYSYDDVMAGRLSPDHIREILGKAFWEHGVQKGTWLLEFETLKRKLEAVETQAKGLEGQLKAVKKTLITWVYHYPTKLREALERALGETLIEEAIP